MKKIICLALTLLMVLPMLSVAVGANTLAYVEYASAQNGDLLYQLDFKGTAGVFTPGDANGAGWNYSNFQPSADGKSAAFEFTTSNVDGEDKSRSRFSGKLENYTLAGNSYTIEFTLDSTALVCIALDGGGGFVIQPTTNSTWIGRYGSWGKIGKLFTRAATSRLRPMLSR